MASISTTQSARVRKEASLPADLTNAIANVRLEAEVAASAKMGADAATYPPYQALLKRNSPWAEELRLQLAQLPKDVCLTLPDHTPGRVRFVCCSDTHCHHDLLEVPQGDVLVHTGDLCGNYGESSPELLVQFRKALNWLAGLSTRFEAVFVVPGNHDTMLDAKAYNTSEAQRLIAALPENCFFLNGEDSPEAGLAMFRGIRIWAAPVVVSRVESLNKRYVSDAFERTHAQRKQVRSFHISLHRARLRHPALPALWRFAPANLFVNLNSCLFRCGKECPMTWTCY